jgi:hypothetical protein
MAAAKRAARRIADRVGGRIGSAQVAWACRRAHGRRLVVLDIDNTLADSWPTYTRTWPDERTRLDAIEPLPGVKAIAHDAALERGDAILFLSHRSWRRWRQTYRWLRRHGFAATPVNVVLVGDPRDKLEHLRRCSGACDVAYWDDLSHSHEHGEALFHDELIDAVRSLPLEYRGWDDIRAAVEEARGA